MPISKFFEDILVHLMFNELGYQTYKFEFVKKYRINESKEIQEKPELLVGIFDKDKKYYIGFKKMAEILGVLRLCNYMHIENINSDKGIFIENKIYHIDNGLFKKINRYINSLTNDDTDESFKEYLDKLIKNMN
jgi:hypothetical protein